MIVSTKLSPSIECMSDNCLAPSEYFFYVYHDENKLLFDEIWWWWCPLSTRPRGSELFFLKLKVIVRKVLVLSEHFKQLSIITLYVFNCLALHCCEKIWPKVVSEDFGALEGIWCKKKFGPTKMFYMVVSLIFLSLDTRFTVQYA
jgi:hypothetical protein